MNQAVTDIFSNQTKDQIEVILDYFRMDPKLTAKKADLLRQLSDFISDCPEVWLGMLLEPDLRILQKLCVAGPEVQVPFLKPDFPSIIEILKFVRTTEPDDDTVEMSVPLAIYEVIEPVIDKVVEKKEKEGLFDIERMVLGCLNIYGVMPLHNFVEAMYAGVDSDDKATELTGKLSDCPLVRIYQEMLDGECYIATPFVDNFKEILEMRKMSFKKIRKYPKLNIQAAIACGTDAPFCAYGLDTPEGIALRDMLKSIGYEGDGLRLALHTVWMSSQYATDEESTEVLFSPVTDRQDFIPSFEMFRDCIEKIVAYANATPKWLLKGNTPDKAGKMKLSVRISDLAESYGGADPYMQIFDMGLAVHPVDPDMPCPCGSGFSYRFCHGKYLS